MPELPIHPCRPAILRALEGPGGLLLTAPTGSGKSTQVPRFLLERRCEFPGRVLVLQPRRLAARSLAHRVAFETGARLGGEVGYQVRFESRCGADTAVVFQTYGVFVQRMLADPRLVGVGAVLLDEFHERTLECDLALAWLKAVRRERRRDLKLAVMSATLEAAPLLEYLPGAQRVDVPGKLFPVEDRWLPLESREDAAQASLRALRLLAQEGLDGSVLVFMPGFREIRRTVAALAAWCRERGLPLLELHGSMDLAEQQRVLDPEPGQRRVIVATNVAETSLTIPGVTMVVDSGLQRVAAYSPGRDINTLYLGRISRGNAAQRAGRAGRTAPGRCVKLWSRAEDASMPASLAPEVSRLELSALFLQAASLPEPVDWLTPPRPEAWSRAAKTLASLGAVEAGGRAPPEPSGKARAAGGAVDGGGRITPAGKSFLRYPVAPRLGAVLEGARGLGAGAFESAAAMVAVYESVSDRRQGPSLDLRAAGESLLAGRDEDLPWEAAELLRQLKRAGGAGARAAGGAVEAGGRAPPEPSGKARAAGGAVGDIGGVWLSAFEDRLACRAGDGPVYDLLDGRRASLTVEKGRTPPDLLLALEVHESAGAGQARQVRIPLYLPCGLDAVQALHPGECVWKEVAEFDDRAKMVVHERRLMFRGLALARKPAGKGEGDRKTAAGLWATRFASGELRHPGFDGKVEQLVARILLGRRLYPDYGFPAMDPEDWALIYGEVCEGRGSLREIERVPLQRHVERYLGPALAGFLDKALPSRWKLASGRDGRLTYSESRPAELSARLGDFLGMKGRLALCEGRLAVIFDILAPNFRTVQKTADLSSFWRNTYPAIKKELRRKYPKHPWP
ncbi:MAG: hypothetical protein HY927_07405 [Elusimicrobia bacterium]|nr:hypothetical protein [Elusimicrobiota bacterium]